MNIQTVKLELLRKIINTENLIVLEKITRIIQNEKSDFWNKLSKEEQDEIIGGIEELDNGEKYDYEEFINKHLK
ncbi:MAG: hypothetical protein KAT68_10950 [Bacteroidales bacterium]|nr:hypothetical protein [Bacteroidales bacterium]